MIIYDLKCDNQHEFEGWFKNPGDLQNQQKTGLLTCPMCGTRSVFKQLTASKVGRKSNATPILAPNTSAIERAATAQEGLASGASKASMADKDSSSPPRELGQDAIAKRDQTSESETNETGKGACENSKSPHSEQLTYQKLQSMLNKVHRYVDDNFVDVGNKFADEAIKIHRGEKEPENIRGRASAEQLQELAEEGVSALALPPRPIDKKKLN